MIYFMPGKLYWNYIDKYHLTHEELIAYLNGTLGLMGTIVELHILAD